MRNYLIYLILIPLLSTCASKSDRRFVDLSKEKVEESFDIGKSTLDKFKVVEKADKKKTEKKPIKKVQKKKIVKKTEPKKKKPEVKKEKIVEVKIEDAEVEVEPKKFQYPEGYPERFLDYDKVAAPLWTDFKPKIYPDEEFVFEVSFLGITAGHIKMTAEPLVEVAGEDAFHFKAHMRSARYYKYIYELDDTLESFVSKETFRPIKYTLIQRESAQSVDDLQFFDQEKMKTLLFYKRLKRGQLKKIEKEEWIPRYFQDSYSALYFVRGFPLKLGDKYEFPIVTRGKIWILKMKVEKKEKIKIMGKWTRAIRIAAETRFPGVLKKKGDILFWYSDDDRKKLLKFQAKVKIGSVEGELVEYREGR